MHHNEQNKARIRSRALSKVPAQSLGSPLRRALEAEGFPGINFSFHKNSFEIAPGFPCLFIFFHLSIRPAVRVFRSPAAQVEFTVFHTDVKVNSVAFVVENLKGYIYFIRAKDLIALDGWILRSIFPALTYRIPFVLSRGKPHRGKPRNIVTTYSAKIVDFKLNWILMSWIYFSRTGEHRPPLVLEPAITF